MFKTPHDDGRKDGSMRQSNARTVILILVLVLGAPAAPAAQAVPNAALYEQAEAASTRPDVGKARD